MQCFAAYLEHSHKLISLNVTKGQILIIQVMLWLAAGTEPKGLLLQPLDLTSTQAVPALEGPKNLPPVDFTSCSSLKYLQPSQASQSSMTSGAAVLSSQSETTPGSLMKNPTSAPAE